MGTNVLDVRRIQEQQRKSLMVLGWGVCGVVAAITLGVWFLVTSEGQARRRDRDPGFDRDDGRYDARDPRIAAAIARINATRGLLAQLDSIDAQVRTHPDVDTLGKLFATVHDRELASLAEDEGGRYKARYESLLRTVDLDYIAALQTAAKSAASATTGKSLAPFGELEDALRVVIEDATTANDADTLNIYRPLLPHVFAESNQIAARLFDEAFQQSVRWQDLLGDVSAWQVIPASSFTVDFAAGLVLTNAASPDGVSGGLRYLPGRGWRDYVIDMELKLDAGSLVVCARAGGPMDGKLVPAQTIGLAQDPDVLLEAGRTHDLTIAVIGDRLGVVLDGRVLPRDDSIGLGKSRKGAPGIVAQPGTQATITRLRVRHLR